jgi:presenilin-like A22 family membrane protease
MAYRDYSLIMNIISYIAAVSITFLFIHFAIKPESKTRKINMIILIGSFFCFIILTTLIYIFVNSISLLPILYGCTEGITLTLFLTVLPNVKRKNK